MSVTLQLPAVLAKLADGRRTLEVRGATLGDVVADVAEHEGDLDAQGLDVVQQRRREWAVAAVAVKRGGAIPRRSEPARCGRRCCR